MFFTMAQRKASIHGRPISCRGIKLLGGSQLCENAVYIAKLKYFLIKSQFPEAYARFASQRTPMQA